MKVCVVIPTFNESKAIARLVRAIMRKGHDIVVIDDGSADDTAKIASKEGALVIRHPKNKGKGAAIKSGFRYALNTNCDAVIIMDGDGQHDPEDIGRFVEAAKTTDADMIIGNRMDEPLAMPWVRRVTNTWMSSFISNISGQTIPDTQCGYRLIKRRLLKDLPLVSSKYETESEILIRAGKDNFKILSIPIKSIYKDEVSTINPIKDALRFIRLIVRMKLERIFKK